MCPWGYRRDGVHRLLRRRRMEDGWSQHCILFWGGRAKTERGREREQDQDLKYANINMFGGVGKALVTLARVEEGESSGAASTHAAKKDVRNSQPGCICSKATATSTNVFPISSRDASKRESACEVRTIDKVKPRIFPLPLGSLSRSLFLSYTRACISRALKKKRREIDEKKKEAILWLSRAPSPHPLCAECMLSRWRE